MVVSGVKGTQSQLGSQLAADFSGAGNFFYWVAAILIIGAIGYVDALRGISRMMLLLILIVMLFSNRGFFAQFSQQLQSGTAQAPSSGSGSNTGGSQSPTGGTSVSSLSPSDAATAMDASSLFFG